MHGAEIIEQVEEQISQRLLKAKKGVKFMCQCNQCNAHMMGENIQYNYIIHQCIMQIIEQVEEQISQRILKNKQSSCANVSSNLYWSYII